MSGPPAVTVSLTEKEERRWGLVGEGVEPAEGGAVSSLFLSSENWSSSHWSSWRLAGRHFLAASTMRSTQVLGLTAVRRPQEQPLPVEGELEAAVCGGGVARLLAPKQGAVLGAGALLAVQVKAELERRQLTVVVPPHAHGPATLQVAQLQEPAERVGQPWCTMGEEFRRDTNHAHPTLI